MVHITYGETSLLITGDAEEAEEKSIMDEIYVINVGGYIGESTRSEIEYAKAHGKEVHYLEE